MHWSRMLLWSGRLLAEEDGDRVRTDLVRLIPFDVQIALNSGSDTSPRSFELDDAVNPTILNDIITDWMNEGFKTKAVDQGMVENHTTFQTVALERRIERRYLRQGEDEGELISPQDGIRQLQEDSGGDARLFTASFTGVSLWERIGGVDTQAIDPELVELFQRATFLEVLQDADESTGLGKNVVDVRAFITPSVVDPSSGGQQQSSTTTDNLEIIIIVAIVVACMAFGLLMFAVCWAWRTDQQKRDLYKVDSPGASGQVMNRTPDGTGSESDYEGQVTKNVRNSPPREIDPQDSAYPESVISEDITESLTAYYKSGMAGYGYPAGTGGSQATPVNGAYHPHHSRPMHHNPMTVPKRDFNDGASMSSMDSYGYSLDGYAPSLSGGPTQLGYPVGPVSRARDYDSEAGEESDMEPPTDVEDNE
jgi:hypothetical protein